MLKNNVALTAEQIMSLTKAGDLFSNDYETCKAEFKALAQQWHPDINKTGTKEVFQKINEFHQAALKMIADGVWEKSNYIQLKTALNSCINISYLYTFAFELGVVYVCNKHIIYVFDEARKAYAAKMAQSIKLLKYASDGMRSEFDRYFPKVTSEYQTNDNKFVIVIEKPDDVYPLSLACSFMKKTDLDRHVAWIISRLLNIACYFDYANIVHNGICLNNCFISPEHHTILLLGGWWYTAKNNDKLLGTTKEIYGVMPVSAKSHKISSPITDLESIKLLGRQLLGEPNCRLLKATKVAPGAFIDYLVSGSCNSAYEELQKWDKALELAYGKRKFIKLDITKEQIYSGINIKEVF